MTDDLAADALRILDTVRYVALATIDPDGAPRVSPVFFTRDGRDVYWVSSPDAHHSRNVEREPRAEGVVFDSTVRVGAAEAVYLTGRARRVPAAELAARCAAAYADRRDGVAFTPSDLSGDADLRLYVLEVATWEVLVRGSDPDLGSGIDRRVPVPAPEARSWSHPLRPPSTDDPGLRHTVGVTDPYQSGAPHQQPGQQPSTPGYPQEGEASQSRAQQGYYPQQGHPQGPYPPAGYPYPAYAPEPPGKTMGIVGFVLAFVIAPAGIVVSAMALSESKKVGYPNVLGKWGLWLSIVFTACWLLYVVFIVLAVFGGMLGWFATYPTFDDAGMSV